MSAFKIPEAPYSIEGIMEELAVQFGEAPVGENSASDAQASPAATSAARVVTGEATRDILQQLDVAEHAKFVDPVYRIRSHRHLLRIFIDPIKKIAHWATRPYVALLIEKQQWYNHLMVQVARATAASMESAHQKLDAFIEGQEKNNAEFWEALSLLHQKVDPFINHQDRTNRGFRETLEHQERTNEILREACRRSDASIENQARINQQFQKAFERVEPFVEHQEKTNEIFREALHRSDASIENQARINQLFQGTHERIAPFIDHQEKTNEIFRETLRRLEAFIDMNVNLPGHVHALEERNDLNPFYDQLPEEKRLELMDKFRGTFEDIWGRHHIYLKYLRQRPGHILDVGCGRGEFLTMLRYEGISAWGCEIDSMMAAMAREKDVHVREMDAVRALKETPEGTLGGVFSSQVVEHLFPGEVLGFLNLSRRALAPGGVLIIETLNPQSLGVLAKSYYKDLDHKQPIDPDYLAKLVEIAGFEKVEVHRIREFGAQERLPDLPDPQRIGMNAEAHRVLKKIIDKLNSTIWGAQDYYIVGEVPMAAVAGEASN